ncbi:MAG: hypothetical protein JNM17_21735 [Archangium sp.]|nr:hypothetical protein [Archangium sp.]
MSGPCAVHSDQPWAFTCTRCGSFACAACKGALPGQCLACSKLLDHSPQKFWAIAYSYRTGLWFFALSLGALVLTWPYDLEEAFRLKWPLFGPMTLRCVLVLQVVQAAALRKSRFPALWAVLTFMPWLWLVVVPHALFTLWSYLSKAGLNPGLFALSIPRPGAK